MIVILSVGKFVGSAVFIFFIAVAYEGLKYFREKLFNAQVPSSATECKDGQNLLPPKKTLV